jgi:hypothetical protein
MRVDPACRGRAGTSPGSPHGVEDSITKLAISRLSRPDATDLLDVPEGGLDMTALREKAAAIRRNLEELAADPGAGADRPAPACGVSATG